MNKNIRAWNDFSNKNFEVLKTETWKKLKSEEFTLLLDKSKAKQLIEKKEFGFIENLKINLQVNNTDLNTTFYEALYSSFPSFSQKSKFLKDILRTVDLSLIEVERVKKQVINSFTLNNTEISNLYRWEKEFNINTTYDNGFLYRKNRIRAEKQKLWRQVNKENLQIFSDLFEQGKIIDVYIKNQTFVIRLQPLDTKKKEDFKQFLLKIIEAHLDLEIKVGAIWNDYKSKTWESLKNKTWITIEKGE